MKKTSLIHLPEYFDRYINLCDDVDLLEALQTSITEITKEEITKWKSLGKKIYAPGKWTINEVLQHIIDTERVFAYRALAISRAEKASLPSFDEDTYALASRANARNLEQIVDDLIISHKNILSLYQSFDEAHLLAEGKSFKGTYSVAAIGFTMAGHQRWHLNILRERYYPLIKEY
jgi:hypothetical protein